MDVVDSRALRAVPRFTAAVLLLNFLFEVIAGMMILATPSLVFPNAAPHAAAVARTLACAAISAGFMSLVMLLAYQPGRMFRALLWVLAVFHVLLAAMHGFNWTRGYTAVTGPIGHSLLAVLFFAAIAANRARGSGTSAQRTERP